VFSLSAIFNPDTSDTDVICTHNNHYQQTNQLSYIILPEMVNRSEKRDPYTLVVLDRKYEVLMAERFYYRVIVELNCINFTIYLVDTLCLYIIGP